MTSTSPHQKPIGVGVVGLSASGGWAATAHVPALAGLDGYELRALAASSTESARAAGEKYAVPLTFSSAEELARSAEVDLVVVTVKVPQHLQLIRPALEAGKTVLCEWPLGVDLAQAEELADLAYRMGVVTHVTSGAVAAKTAEDQVVVTGLLESGAVAAMHFRGGTSRATGFHWEINGTEGDVVVKADRSLFGGRLRLYSARGNDGGVTELPVPAHYQRSLTQWIGRSAEPAYNVAHQYALLRGQITGGLTPDTDGVPDFRHAVRRHRMLELIREAARTGRTVTLAEQGT
jgi:predicted dehydrogenase